MRGSGEVMFDIELKSMTSAAGVAWGIAGLVDQEFPNSVAGAGAEVVDSL